MRRRGSAFIVSAAALTCFWPGSGEAADVGAGSMRLAAATIGGETGHRTQDAWAARESDELELLLAQLTPPTTSDPKAETVIAVFAASMPQTADEEVAKTHKLEFVRRLTAGSLEQRIVLYRITDGRSIADVVESLKSDARVSRAQPNVRYAILPQSPPGVRAPAVAPPAPARQGKRATPRPEHRAQRPTAPATVSEAATSRSTSRLRMEGRGAVASSQTALRFPAADEPFVNIGMRNR